MTKKPSKPPRARPKAGKAPKKPKGKATRGPGRPSRNWSRIKSQWLDSPIADLKAFCRAKNLPYSTAKRYLSLADKNKILTDASSHAEKFRDSLVKRAAEEEAHHYKRALKKTFAAVETVLVKASERFNADAAKASRWAGAGEAARVVLSAGAMLNTVAAELQGIPADAADYGWPLTKGFHPLSYQRDFILDTPKSVKFETGKEAFCFVFVGGVGSGKTLCGAEKAGSTAWDHRGRTGVILAPTYRMLEDATKKTFLDVLGRKNLGYKYLKTENAVILFGDTKILFRSMDEPDHLRGPSIAWAWIDEGAQLKTREAYDVVQARIRPDSKDTQRMAVDDKGRRLIFTSTPDGLNWVYDTFVREAEENRVMLYRGRTQSNPYLGDYYNRLLATYDPRFAKQELEAEFLNIFTGQAYWNFSPTESVIKASALPLDRSRPIVLAVDFNVAPMSWNIIQEYKQNGDTFSYVLDEIHIDTASTELAAAELIDRLGGKWKAGIEVYGDATGQHRSTNASRTDYEIIEQALKRAGIPFDINIGAGNPLVTDRIAAVNARLKDTQGVRRMYISHACKHTLTDFEKVGFIPGTRQLNKSDSGQTHHTDAIGYYLTRRWPIFGPEVRQYKRGRN